MRQAEFMTFGINTESKEAEDLYAMVKMDTEHRFKMLQIFQNKLVSKFLSVMSDGWERNDEYYTMTYANVVDDFEKKYANGTETSFGGFYNKKTKGEFYIMGNIQYGDVCDIIVMGRTTEEEAKKLDTFLAESGFDKYGVHFNSVYDKWRLDIGKVGTEFMPRIYEDDGEIRKELYVFIDGKFNTSLSNLPNFPHSDVFIPIASKMLAEDTELVKTMKETRRRIGEKDYDKKVFIPLKNLLARAINETNKVLANDLTPDNTKDKSLGKGKGK